MKHNNSPRQSADERSAREYMHSMTVSHERWRKAGLLCSAGGLTLLVTVIILAANPLKPLGQFAALAPATFLAIYAIAYVFLALKADRQQSLIRAKIFNQHVTSKGMGDQSKNAE